ncbi:MAG: hypothetical protein QGG40_10110, partial [Myxococcota bacterium]|nr:hypothetical protein [Myxococcota bacterium]
MFAWLWTFVSLAAGARLQLDLPSRELVVGEVVELEVKLIDGRAQGLPDVPTGAGLQAQFMEQVQSHVIVNFQSARIVRYRYRLSALTQG